MNFDKFINFSPTLFIQSIDNEIVLLDMESEAYFGLDEMGSIIWKLMEEKNYLFDIFIELSNRYDISKEELEKELSTFINKLIDLKIISLSSSPS